MKELIDELIKINEEVFYLSDEAASITGQHFSFLSKQAAKNRRKRCRICTHQSADAVLHEMFIMHSKGNYVPPHAHMNSDESLTLIKGEGAMFLYDGCGNVTRVIYLNADVNKGVSYVRTPKGVFHSLFILSDEFLFKEAVLGPFERSNMIESVFAPKEDDIEKVNAFLLNCQEELQRVLKYDR